MHPPHQTATRRLLLIPTVAAGLVLLPAAAASAHVTVHGDAARPGGYAELTFRVPTEKSDVSTTQLEVALPTEHPILSVAVKPHTGWHVTTQMVTLAKPVSTDDGPVNQVIDKITWTADSPASALRPGQFDDFALSAGPLPKVETLTFPVIQTYSDGSTVDWIETPAPGSDTEPEHPAPTLTLASDTPSAATPAGSAAAAATTSSTTLPTALSIAALVVAAAALVLTGLTVLRRRAPR